MPQVIHLRLDDQHLIEIDAAREVLGQTRAEYLRRCALIMARGSGEASAALLTLARALRGTS